MLRLVRPLLKALALGLGLVNEVCIDLAHLVIVCTIVVYQRARADLSLGPGPQPSAWPKKSRIVEVVFWPGSKHWAKNIPADPTI